MDTCRILYPWAYLRRSRKREVRTRCLHERRRDVRISGLESVILHHFKQLEPLAGGTDELQNMYALLRLVSL